MKILYHAINGTGLGHVTRLAAIALAVRRQDSETHQLFVTTAALPHVLDRAGLPYVRLPACDTEPARAPDRRLATISHRVQLRLIFRVAEDYRPDVIVFDTHFAGRLVQKLRAEVPAVLALVLRQCRDAYLREKLDRGELVPFERLLIPHDPDELIDGLPDDVARRLRALSTARWVGPIVRPLDETPGAGGLPAAALLADELSERISGPPEQPFVLVTCGAGGYVDSARAFVDRAVAAARCVADERDMGVVVVGGPYNRLERPPTGCTFFPAVADLIPLLKRTAVAIAHAGYNTVNEILATGAPAVLLPLPRLNEDQGSRARRLADGGRVELAAVGDPTDQVADACRLALARGRYPRCCLGGAQTAASELIELATSAGRTVLSGRLGDAGLGRASSPSALATTASRQSAPRQAPRVLLDWNQLGEWLAGRAATIGATNGSTLLEVYIGDGPVSELAARALGVLAGTAAAKMPGPQISLVFDDRHGGRGLPALAKRLRTASIRDLVAIVDRVDSETVFQVFEACRALALPFRVDLTSAQTPRLWAPDR